MEKYYSRDDYVLEWEKDPKVAIVFNKIEKSRYATDSVHDIILTGTAGEKWVMTEEAFDRKYKRLDGNKCSPKKKRLVYARKADGKELVPTHDGVYLTANRDGIDHGDGDMVVYSTENEQPNMDDCWLVNGVVFAKTYELAS